MSNMVSRGIKDNVPCNLGLESLTSESIKQRRLLLLRENILLDTSAHHVGPEGAESERTPHPPRQKN